MKKIILLFLLTGFFLASCKKENKKSDKPDTKNKYTVTFNVGADDKKTTASLTTHALTSVADVANYLVYTVYNSDGNLITQLKQDTSATNFGHITDTFAPGNYTIVIFSSLNHIPGISESHANSFFDPNAKYLQADNNDVFIQKFPITVANEPITQSINLERVVGQLQIKILDTIPATAKSIRVQITSDRKISLETALPNAQDSVLRDVTYTLPKAVKQKPDYTITTFMSNTVAPFKVNITALDTNDDQIADVTINNVICAKNTRTLLSGNLGFVNSNAGFNITLNQTWVPTPLIIKF